MPYVTCSACATTTYSAARFSTRDDCPRCGRELPRPQRAEATAATCRGRPQLVTAGR